MEKDWYVEFVKMLSDPEDFLEKINSNRVLIVKTAIRYKKAPPLSSISKRESKDEAGPPIKDSPFIIEMEKGNVERRELLKKFYEILELDEGNTLEAYLRGRFHGAFEEYVDLVHSVLLIDLECQMASVNLQILPQEEFEKAIDLIYESKDVVGPLLDFTRFFNQAKKDVKEKLGDSKP